NLRHPHSFPTRRSSDLGDFATSAKTFASTSATSEKLGTDPFVAHIRDCHDCDHEKYANAAWTHASVVQKLVELDKAATGKDEARSEEHTSELQSQSNLV